MTIILLFFKYFFYLFSLNNTVNMVIRNFLVTPKLFLNTKVPYPYEVNWHLVTGNGSLTTICSLSNCSLSPSLTVLTYLHVVFLIRSILSAAYVIDIFSFGVFFSFTSNASLQHLVQPYNLWSLNKD